MNPELISDVLTGARMIECNPDTNLMVIWYGGHSLFNIYDLTTFDIIDAWTQHVDTAQEAQVAAREYLGS